MGAGVTGTSRMFDARTRVLASRQARHRHAAMLAGQVTARRAFDAYLAGLPLAERAERLA
jgi:hypothetical protein